MVNKRVLMALFGIGATAVLLLAAVAPVGAQDPTPWPTPIATGDYVIYQTMTYGERGIILGLIVVCGLLLLNLMMHVIEKLVEQ